MNNNYGYDRTPLDKGITRALIIELFQGKGYHKVDEIREQVKDTFFARGGKKIGVKNFNSTVSRILTELEKNGKAEKHPHSQGIWQIFSNNGNSSKQTKTDLDDKVNQVTFDTNDLVRLKQIAQELQELLTKYEDSP